METNKQDVGGNWSETLETLSRLYTQLTTEFGVDPNMVESHLRPMTIRTLTGPVNTLRLFFPRAAMVDETTV